MEACGFLPLALPNHLPTVRELMERLPVAGIILTGGNDLASCGGDAPERDGNPALRGVPRDAGAFGLFRDPASTDWGAYSGRAPLGQRRFGQQLPRLGGGRMSSATYPYGMEYGRGFGSGKTRRLPVDTGDHVASGTIRAIPGAGYSAF